MGHATGRATHRGQHGCRHVFPGPWGIPAPCLPGAQGDARGPVLCACHVLLLSGHVLCARIWPIAMARNSRLRIAGLVRSLSPSPPTRCACGGFFMPLCLVIRLHGSLPWMPLLPGLRQPGPASVLFFTGVLLWPTGCVSAQGFGAHFLCEMDWVAALGAMGDWFHDYLWLSGSLSVRAAPMQTPQKSPMQ